MEKLADISSFESLAGNQVFVSNKILERLRPNPDYAAIMRGAGMAESSKFLGERGDDIPLAYQKYLTPGGWGHGTRTDEAVKASLQRGRGVGKSLHSLLKGMELLVQRYIEHTAPETKFVKEMLVKQKEDILHFIGFLKDPIVRKQLHIGRTNFKDVEMLTTAYIQKMKGDIESQIMTTLDDVQREVRAEASAAKSLPIVDQWKRLFWDRIPDGLRDILWDNRVAKLKLRGLPADDKKAEFARYLRRKAALRDEAMFIKDDSLHPEAFGYTEGDGSYADQASQYYLKSLGDLPGRFSGNNGNGNNGNGLWGALGDNASPLKQLLHDEGFLSKIRDKDSKHIPVALFKLRQALDTQKKKKNDKKNKGKKNKGKK